MQAHGEKFLGEQLVEELAAGAASMVSCPDGDLRFGMMQGLKEGKSDDVIPMHVGEEEVEFTSRLPHERLSERPRAGSGINEEVGALIAHF